jgi:hypothetical protein
MAGDPLAILPRMQDDAAGLRGVGGVRVGWWDVKKKAIKMQKLQKICKRYYEPYVFTMFIS